MSYVVNRAMTGGYAFVAWPVKWGGTGVMTFIAGKDEHVYENDLGTNGSSVAMAMKEFTPESTWSQVPQK